MKFYLFFVCSILIIGCADDEASLTRVTDNFELNYEGKGTIIYSNSECEFDDRKNQSQFTYTSTSTNGDPRAYVLFSTYKNLNGLDSVINQVWLHLFVEYSNGQNNFTHQYLEGLLNSEDSNENTKHLYPSVQVEICGERYDNADIKTETGESVYKFNDEFKYKINDFEVLYFTDCVDRELLFMDFTFEGMLYQHRFGEKHDSLYLNESNLKLLFDID